MYQGKLYLDDIGKSKVMEYQREVTKAKRTGSRISQKQ